MSTDASPDPSSSPPVAVIGGGVMGETIVSALRVGGWPGDAIIVANRGADRRVELEAEHGIRSTPDAAEAARDAAVVVLAVKPQQMGDVLDSLAGAIEPSALVVTVASALPAAYYEERLPVATPVVRAMPNTPALVGAGATAIAPGANATEAHLQLVERMLRTTGLVVRVDEPLIDAVIAVAGSAPAYFYAMLEALVEAGVMQGLDRDLATTLAQQTFVGAARLLVESGDTPQELRRRVSSPGGTTLAALEAMEHAGLQGVVSAGANAAVHRSKELGAQLGG